MTADELLSISRYVMPAVPARPSSLAFLFGTRHGVDKRHRPYPVLAAAS